MKILRRLGDVLRPGLAWMLFWALAGAALPLLTSINDVVVASTGPLGAASAMPYVALARLVRRPASSVA